jgi:hypothetical protein
MGDYIIFAFTATTALGVLLYIGLSRKRNHNSQKYSNDKAVSASTKTNYVVIKNNAFAKYENSDGDSILENCIQNITNENYRKRYKNAVKYFGGVIFEENKKLFHSKCENEKPYETSGFYWHETSPQENPYSMWQFKITTTFVLPKCVCIINNKCEDRASEFVEIMGLKYESASYNAHFGRGVSQVLIPVVGVQVTCSGAKQHKWYDDRRYSKANIPKQEWCGPKLNDGLVPGWVGATAGNDVEVFMYPNFATENLEFVENT